MFLVFKDHIYITEENADSGLRNHPPYYFDPPKQMVSIFEEHAKFQFQPKNVRFDTSVEHHLAAHDYRIAHATRKAIRYTTDMHKQLALRSGFRKSSGKTTLNSNQKHQKYHFCMKTYEKTYVLIKISRYNLKQL